jgi:ParB/RepB/Spo0J family partition protein
MLEKSGVSLGSMSKVQEIKIADIKILGDRRSLNLAKVDEIAESISKIGQTDPVEVRVGAKWDPNKEAPIELVDGWHRVEAMKKLGLKKILCLLVAVDAQMARKRQISKSLHRAELTPLEYAEHVAEWVELTEDDEVDRHDVQKSGPGRPKGAITTAVEQLAVKGKTDEAKRKTVERSIKIAAISDRAKKVSKANGLDQELTKLLKIAQEKTPEAQVKKARELAALKTTKGQKRKSAPVPQQPVKPSPSLSPAEKHSLQRLLKLWKKHIQPALDKASSKVRDQFFVIISKDRAV